MPTQSSGFPKHGIQATDTLFSAKLKRRVTQTEYAQQQDALLQEDRIRTGIIYAACALLITVIFAVVGSTCTANVRGVNVGNENAVLDMQVLDAPLQETTAGISEIINPTIITTQDVEGVPASDSAQGFSLLGNETPAFDEAALASISEALDAVKQYGDAGFVFVNVNTGKGIAYNSDAAIYGASSFKALYALYICEYLAEAGTIDLQAPIGTYYNPETIGENYQDLWYLLGSDGYLTASTEDTVADLIEGAILYSDNDAFVLLRHTFDSFGYEDWAHSLSVLDADIDPSNDFPTYSAKSSAKLWCEMYNYIYLGSDNAQWLESLTGSTETSFLRDALADIGAMVMDKAGWINEWEATAVVDAGIVEMDGETYIMSIMTSMPQGDETDALFENLANAIYNTRESLVSENAQAN